MFIVYVLEDETGRFYKGVTNNLEKRLREHKCGHTRTTSRMRGLKVVYKEKFSNFNEARKREVYLKTGAGRKFLKKQLGL